MSGIKEENEKLMYELDWEFVQKMAERMAMNKGKYPPFNWQKGIDVEKLNQALIRHFMAIQMGEKDEQKYGHYYALACNAMMIIYQKERNDKERDKKDVI